MTATSQRFPHLAQRLFNQPLMIHPQKAEIVMAALADRLGISHMMRGGEPSVVMLAPELDERASQNFSRQADWKPFECIEGIAIIPVEGTLVQKLGTLQPYSGMTGYDGIRATFLAAIDDPDVRAIIFQIDSPGGEVAGCFDLADTIKASRGGKRIWAVLDEVACSAAYAIACAADHITMPRTGIVGSIGVIAMLVDLSEAITKAGMKVNIIQFGARKADGSEFQALPDAARQRFQAQIDMLGELFVSTVATSRRIAAADVRATEAATFTAPEALKLGLVDAISSPDAALDALLTQIR